MKTTNSTISQTKTTRILCIVGTVLFAACLVVYIACYGIQLKEMEYITMITVMGFMCVIICF